MLALQLTLKVRLLSIISEEIGPGTEPGLFIIPQPSLMPESHRGRKNTFAIGDRVIHKSNPFSTVQGQRRLRHGVVVDITYKTNARGAKHPYITVKFDNSERQETFMSSRIEHEANKAKVLADAVESVYVS